MLKSLISHQIFRFAIVGLVATVMHVCIAIFLVEFIYMPYLWANFCAFMSALLLSFFGHYHWTFSARSSYQKTLPKFFVTAVVGLTINQAIMFGAVDTFDLDYRLGLFFALSIAPLAVFLLSKSWAFGHKNS